MKLLFVLAPIVVAASEAAAISFTAFDDNYDNLGTSVAVGIPQIGEYNGLNYSGWALATQGASGLAVHSPPNGAVAVTPLTVATGNPGMISAGPGTRCFDLESFYFGCIVSAGQGAATLASSCGISLSGVRAFDGRAVGEVAFNYDVGGNPASSPMRFADVSKNIDYKCLESVTISDITTFTRVIIDDFVHVNYR